MTLASEYPKEQARLLALLERYKEIGPAGSFAYHSIKEVLMEANKASAEQDIVAMVRAFATMKECK